MKPLTTEGQQQINSIASRYGISQDAVMSMLQSVVNGGGRMAQFNIYELGGGGQWMQGGMTMVGDMFNYSLKNTVNNLCQELSNLISSQNIFVNIPQANNNAFGGGFAYAGNWWPSELGSPSSSGSQNNIKYAFFPPPVSRLAIEINGEVSVYNTLDHNISGVSQQQGGGFSVLFSSQYGYVDVLNLPIVSGPGTIKQDTTPAPIPTPIADIVATLPNQSNEPSAIVEAIPTPTTSMNDIDIFNKIDRLAELFNKGVLTEEEFLSKKSELLSRL